MEKQDTGKQGELKMKRMIKALALIIVLVLTIGLCGCGSQENAASDAEDSAEQTESAANEDADEDDTTVTDEDNDEEDTEMNGSKILVAYFSATGTTKQLTGTIAEVTGGDLYEIVPEEPYTDEDLDWNDNSSRTTVEQNDSSSRPAISGSIENFDDYDVIFLGYPIWWYDAPHIMFTFAESYDFDGKTVIPFCTSGGSGIGTSGDNIEACAGSGTWSRGARMSGSASESEVSEWIRGLGITPGE